MLQVLFVGIVGMKHSKNDTKDIIRDLMKFIDESPCNYYAVANVEKRLQSEGFELLDEKEKWSLKKNGKYYVKRNDSSLIAFALPKKAAKGFRVAASHSDSPCFKIKENPELDVHGKYTRLSVEPYGGMLMATWLDRPLSVAGRIMITENGELATKLVNIDRDMLLIPNLAIHMNREANNGYAYKKHIDMIPLWTMEKGKGSFEELIRKQAGLSKEQKILGMDLVLYNRMKCTRWGEEGEFISGPRLDDLECAFATLEAFIGSRSQEHIPVYCLYDNEEVGSGTRQGAESTFLKDTLKRIVYGLGETEEDYLRYISDSFLVSADNAHAVHPNFPEISDGTNRCYLNEGIAIKFQASQKYATDAYSAAVFREAAEMTGSKVQTYANRSDIAGGSTLGNISTTQVPIRTVDVGFPQLAMHSSYETAGTKDILPFIDIMREIYE